MRRVDHRAAMSEDTVARLAIIVVSTILVGLAAVGLTPAPQSGPGVVVHSHSWGLADAPVLTWGMNVTNGSDIFVFIGYVDAIGGGGTVAFVNDSVGNAYHLISEASTGTNRTESLYLATDVLGASNVILSVKFWDGGNLQGGAVEAVDVTGAGSSPINALGSNWGTNASGLVGSVSLTATAPGDLFLIGVTGQAIIADVSPGPGQTLLDTGGGLAGPFIDGEGFGTLSAYGHVGPTTFDFGLQNPAVWAAIAVGVQ